MAVQIDLLSYQIPFFKEEDKKVLAFIGGTGTGKTFLIPRWLYVNMSKYPGEEWVVSSPTIGMLKRNPIKYICKFFDEIELPYKYNKSDLTIENDYGIIYLLPASEPDRMQGVHAKGIIGDEAGLFSRLWWDTAIQRASFKNGQILLTTTPYAENWLKMEVWDSWRNGDRDILLVNPMSIDNPYYPRSEFEKAKKRLPTWKFKQLYEGKFTKPAGLIYPKYKVVKPFIIPDHWERIGGVDFGYNNPFAVIKIAINPDTEDMYIYEEFKKTQLDINEMFNILKEEDIIYYGDYASKESLETLRRMGIRIRNANKDVNIGISFLQALFNSQKLQVFSNLPFLLDELNTYQWDMDRNENFVDRPKKENDHLLDALRYAIFTRFGNKANARIRWV